MRKEKVEIKKLGINGEGIGYVQKKICFIENALPGEIVEIEIVEENRKYLKGKVVGYVQKSSQRVSSMCKENKFCQGCSLLNLNYKDHLDFKKNLIFDALRKHSELNVGKMPVQNVIGASKTKGYKKVVGLPITYFNGKVGVGIYQRESKYLTFMNKCAMQDPLINEVLIKIENILNKHKVRDYNDKIKKGLRFIKMRNIDGAIQVLFVTGTNGIKEEVTKEISLLDEVKSIFWTVNTSRYQDFELQGYKKIYGQSTLPYQAFDQQYVYSMKSDFPVHPEMELKKLEIIKSFIPTNASVLSLHCGIGLMELSMNNDIVAIDEKNYHIKDAKDNAKFLHRENIQFICKNVEEAMISQCKKRTFDCVVVHSGELTPSIQQSLILSKVKDVIYVSDHPSSMAKDLDAVNNYYDVETMIPLDMYPNTAKVEVIVKLHRK
ncbi:MAG: 23S rRNA (uracil(1939)-C(5))-methyltransferase RlmD [Erysipelotrichales bacterium]|nr:23S rRNA (uracil(1939)-C(5))-methyltransferase RlmD [Erysipelotrichales bacterium]